LDEYDLLPRATMVKQMHFPRDYDELEDAKYRYMFEKILKLQIVSLQARSAYQQ
jgi:RecG-like helicase